LLTGGVIAMLLVALMLWRRWARAKRASETLAFRDQKLGKYGWLFKFFGFGGRHPPHHSYEMRGKGMAHRNGSVLHSPIGDRFNNPETDVRSRSHGRGPYDSHPSHKKVSRSLRGRDTGRPGQRRTPRKQYSLDAGAGYPPNDEDRAFRSPPPVKYKSRSTRNRDGTSSTSFRENDTSRPSDAISFSDTLMADVPVIFTDPTSDVDMKDGGQWKRAVDHMMDHSGSPLNRPPQAI
jgi:hypothetical protein